MQRGVVEVLACTAWGKTHESVLVLDVEPYVLQVGLLLLGLHPSAVPDSADRVDVRVLMPDSTWTSAWSLLSNLRTGKPLPAAGWWFRGARVVDGVFTAGRTGTLVATYHDPDAIVDNPYATGNDDEVVAIDTTAVPSRGTPVQVEFSPWHASDLQQGARSTGRGVIPDAGTTAPVIVTATRLHRALPEVPGGAIVVRPAAIAALPAVQPGLLLHMIPGHHIFDATGNQSRLVASPRGFTAAGEGEYLALLVDGIPANELQKGIADFNLVSLMDLQRVEVLRGPASALYGDLATAGVVSLESRLRARPWLATRLGAYGEWAVEGGAGWFGSSGHLGASAAWSLSKGWRDNSEWETTRIHARGAMDVGKGQLLTGSALGVRSRTGDPGPVPRDWLMTRSGDAFFPADGQAADRVLAGLQLRGPLWRSLEHSSLVYYRGRAAEVTRTLAASVQALDTGRETIHERAFGLEFRGTSTLAAGRQTVQLGFEAERGTLEDTDFTATGELTAAGEARRVKVAPFLQSVTVLGRGLQFTLGARYDYFRLRFDASSNTTGIHRSMQLLCPKVALNWRHGDSNVYTSVSRVFKIPTLEQMYEQRQPFGLALANPDLEPQRGESYEIGARIDTGGSTAVDLALYKIEMHEEISFDASTYSYENIGRSSHRGLELALRRRWGDVVTGGLTYAWNDARFRSGESSGKRINGTPEHRSFITLDVALPLACRMGLAVELNGAQMLDDANTAELQGFATTNLRLRRAFGRGAAYVQIDNVFDHGGAVSGYVLPFDGAEMLYPRMPRRVLLGFDLTP